MNSYLSLIRSWIYDTSCGIIFCNTTQGPKGKVGNLSRGLLVLYVGNGQREAVEAIGNFDLSLPSGLVIVLNNCHYAPSITRGVISVSRLYEDGFINRFVNNTIQVSRNNMVYFSAIPRDGIFEIDLFKIYANENSIYTVSNKRAKLDLDSALLWHCRLGHISKKRIEKLQHDGLLNSTDLRAFEKCVPCMSGKMARKPYTHQVERAKDLLGLIHHRNWGSEALVKARYSLTKPDEVRTYVLLSRIFLINQEARWSLEDLEIIQKKIYIPFYKTLSLNHEEDDLEIDEPQSDIIPIHNEVWVLVELPPNGKTVGSKWLFKKKTDIDGVVHTYKARLVVKGYTQTPGINYEETFSPVTDIRAIRILIAIAAYYDYEI
ncbi:retrotransposon protein, putative, ty1-copia subclass [Tanacetum coccineum]